MPDLAHLHAHLPSAAPSHPHNHAPHAHPAQPAPWSLLRMGALPRLGLALGLSVALWAMIWLAMQ
jgi:hypothetical protein